MVIEGRWKLGALMFHAATGSFLVYVEGSTNLLMVKVVLGVSYKFYFNRWLSLLFEVLTSHDLCGGLLDYRLSFHFYLRSMIFLDFWARFQ